MNSCPRCGSPIRQAARGRTRIFCTDRCRKQFNYSTPCVDCGCETNGSDGRGHTRCGVCRARYQHEAKFWTQERVLSAIRRAAAENGGVAPSVAIWFSDRPDWAPSPNVVGREFGSWSAAVRAAGVQPARRGRPLRKAAMA
jgi:hypothetical protein